MAKKYVALYREGNCQPLGAIREDIAEQVMSDLKAGTSKNYWTRPITSEQAKQITDGITRCSEGVEKLLSKK